ncbi:MAG: class A beta-lactamase-related serine hydrolase [Acidobacteria bacterium]|nr:class A beta-lactamase-related serine hydrolase [Acidobacteriota bacterium]MCA1639063.1 class A beta-lactamase-related serine hydrolase [Acidobacteriota bacterium]
MFKRTTLCLMILLVATSLAFAQRRAKTPIKNQSKVNSVAPQPLDERIKAALADFRGNAWIYAKNLDTGKDYAFRADEQVRTASTIKLAIMTEVFAQVAEGKRKWTDELTLTKQNRFGGSGVLGEFSDGTKIDLKTATNLMIVVSDNTATNLILDAITADAVNARMDALGLKQTRSLGKIGGGARSKAWEEPVYKVFGIGVTSPRDMVRLLEMLEKGEVVNKQSSADMIAILRRQQYNDGIGRGLLDSTPSASKSGALDRLRSDLGIVYTRRGRIAMAITLDDMPVVHYSQENPGLAMLWKLSQILQEGLAR